MEFQHTFQPSDEQRFQRVAELVTMRRPFAIMLIVCGIVFISIGLGIIKEEHVPGARFIGIGLAAVFMTIRIISRVSKLRSTFGRAIRTAPRCTWILDDAGIYLAPDPKLLWKRFKLATFCGDGTILTGEDFVWIPSEAFKNPEEIQRLRTQLTQVGVRCVTTAKLTTGATRRSTPLASDDQSHPRVSRR